MASVIKVPSKVPAYEPKALTLDTKEEYDVLLDALSRVSKWHTLPFANRTILDNMYMALVHSAS